MHEVFWFGVLGLFGGMEYWSHGVQELLAVCWNAGVLEFWSVGEGRATRRRLAALTFGACWHMRPRGREELQRQASVNYHITMQHTVIIKTAYIC